MLVHPSQKRIGHHLFRDQAPLVEEKGKTSRASRLTNLYPPLSLQGELVHRPLIIIIMITTTTATATTIIRVTHRLALPVRLLIYLTLCQFVPLNLQTSAELNRNDVMVVVISTMSSLSSAVKNFIFQAAVPKVIG